MQNNQPEVFIAYSSNDRNYAEMLAKRLLSEDLNVWLDRETLEPDQSIDEEIIAVLESCSVCLILVSNSSNRKFAGFQSGEVLGSSYGDGAYGSAPYGGPTSSYTGILTTLANKQSKGNFHVVPILLANTKRDEIKNPPAFLQSLEWYGYERLIEDKDSFQSLLDFIQASDSDQPIKNRYNVETRGSYSIQAAKKIVRLPDIDWVEIPAGPFIYGEGETQQTINLPRFFISRYPITNCQYECFIDGKGYQDERWWLTLKNTEPKQQKWKQANYPRESVNWYEAVAFTRWLSAQFNYEITLPTEQQWEKAARGTDGRKFPWGDGFKTGDANVYDSFASDDNLEQTSAVGLYPHRPSPFGVEDMAGNIWEWCLNKYSNPEQIEPDQNNNSRVLRGGSWGDNSDSSLCVNRGGFNPVNRDYLSGFRVVCSSPHI